MIAELRRWWRRRVRPLPQEPWEQALDDAAEATGQDIDQ